MAEVEVEAEEAAECPICLQSYDHSSTVPRVLSCGHTACESCLTHLHHQHSHSLVPHSLRCPCCTHLVPFTHAHALPKNIDLLRFSHSTPPTTNHHQNKQQRQPPHFLPFWSEHFYAAWKHWILPPSTLSKHDGKIVIKSDSVGLCLSPVLRSFLVGNHEVGLVCIASFDLTGPNASFFEYSYEGQIMCVLCSMNDGLRNEVNAILGVCLRNSRVCNVFGLWLDVETDGSLYIVCKRMKSGLLNLEHGVGLKSEDWGSCFGLIGAELCEALFCLHSEGFVCGCLGLSCLCFDEFGHVLLDIGESLVVGRKFNDCVIEGVNSANNIEDSEVEALAERMSNLDAFVSPEVLLELLHSEGLEVQENNTSFAVCYGSDVWLLACVLIRLLIGKRFVVEMCNYLRDVFQGEKMEGFSGYKSLYIKWVETINSILDPLVVSDCVLVHEVLLKCLDYDPRSRPLVIDVWKCLKGLNKCRLSNHFSSSFKSESVKDNIGQCLALGELCNVSNDRRHLSRISSLPEEQVDCKPDTSVPRGVRVDNVVKGLSTDKVQCKDLHGHRDCITGLCAGGGYLFSSSFDKTINVWSLQDLSHVHTFRGHEHKVMALVFVNQENPLCISADSGSGIFAWEINESLAEEPLMKWYEEKDWRYSGIHALAVSESGCLYTGSGDRLIKAWSVRDHTLLCSMEGHKSVVSALALSNGVLYSGSWDGTVRLWGLHDHSPLAVFADDISGTVSSVLSLFADQNTIIAAHENGCVKIWMNDVLKASTKIHNGAIFSLAMEGKWLFFGGWDRTVKVQEMLISGSEMEIVDVGSVACDSVITALLCAQGILFVGCANKLIKHTRRKIKLDGPLLELLHQDSCEVWKLVYRMNLLLFTTIKYFVLLLQATHGIIMMDEQLR